jgi:phage terminase Nu1 subunit (DNA packaging protein)
MADVKKSDIAVAMEVDPAMITRWAKRGMPLYSIQAAKQWREQHIRPRFKSGLSPANGAAAAAPGSDEPTWRARREQAEAQLAELTLQEREGALVKREEVERAARRLASAIVQQMVSIPDRISAEFGVDDAMRRHLRQRLREELDQVRAEFARAGMMAQQ